MSKMDHTRLEGLLDWLADEVAARLQAREGAAAPPEAKPEPAPVEPAAASLPAAADDRAPSIELEGSGEDLVPRMYSSSHAQLLGRLVAGVLIIVALINIPLNRNGIALARMIPSSNPLVVRDGLLIQEAGTPDVYVYQGGQFHWITDIGVFERRGYRWAQVQTVAPGFLAGYEIGRPLYLLAKCPSSPHIYRVENGARRWIADIATFEAEGYQWSDVQTMDCYALRNMPEGETIPVGRGPAPQP